MTIVVEIWIILPVYVFQELLVMVLLLKWCIGFKIMLSTDTLFQ